MLKINVDICQIRITYQNIMTVYDGFFNAHSLPKGKQDIEDIFLSVKNNLQNLINFYNSDLKTEIVKI